MAEATTSWAGESTVPSHRSADQRLGALATLRASAALTTSYVASNHLRCNQGEKLNVRFVFDWDDATSVEWYYEWSSDATTWCREQNRAESAGTTTHTDQVNTKATSADTNWSDTIYAVDIYVRVGIKRTGGSGTNAMIVGVTMLGL